MKINCLFFTCAALTAAVSAQEPVIPAVVVEPEIVEIPVKDGSLINPGETSDSPEVRAARLRLREAQRGLNAALARQRLSIAPVVIDPKGDDLIKTTKTTTRVEVPGEPTRVYNAERSIVIVEGRELPYLTLPVLFTEGTADLLDDDSRLAVEDIAIAIRGVLETSPEAVFDVEGHTSTDGGDEMNMNLSADRARRIYQELTDHYKLPTSALAAHGYGENFPKFPEGTEEQMVEDRRVLVVRVK